MLQNCNVDFPLSQDYAYDKMLFTDPLNDFTKQGQSWLPHKAQSCLELVNNFKV